MSAKFSVFEFSNKEIDQICDLAKLWATGSNSPIDRRRYTKQVLKYAENWRLIIKGENLERPWSETIASRYYFNDSIIYRFEHIHDLPIEALWQLVRENILTENKVYGHSIVNNSNWIIFNTYPLNHRHASNRDWQTIFDIFAKLAMYGFITFQTAGNIWRIEIK